MNHVKTLVSKAFTWSVVATTIAWSMGVSLIVPVAANAATTQLNAGDLIRVDSDSTKAVYLIGSDLKRYYFPNQAVFNTWYPNFNGVKIINSDTFDMYALGGGVNPRPGSCYLTKSPASASVYAILPGNKKAKLASADIAAALYGSNWVSCLTKPWADTFDANLTQADPITEAKFHDGQLVKQTGSTTVYEVVGGKLQKVEGTLSSVAANDVHSVSSLASYTMDTATVTSASLVADPVQKGTNIVVTPTTGSVSVALSANSPAAGYIAKGAYNAEFARFTVRANGGSARVNKIVVKREGLGSDSDISAVRIYDGSKQLGSDQALNSTYHTATFNNIKWDLAAGESRTLIVTADTVTSTSGTNDLFTVTTADLGDGTSASGLPVSGNPQQYHNVTVGILNITASASPGATTLISGSTAQELACYTLTTTNSNEGIRLRSVKFTNNGTIGNDEVSNFVVKDGATVLGSTQSTFSSDGTVVVDMTSNPYFIDKNKTRTLCVSADIKGNITTSKTIILQIADSKDVIATGDDSKAQLVVTTGSAALFTAQSSQTMTIGQGSLTVARNTATLPVSAGLVDGIGHNKLSAYRFSAGSTEGVTVTRLRLTVTGANVGSADFSNFQLYTYNESTGAETAVGSAQSISGSYVTFEDTADGLFNVDAGKNVVVHVYADVNNAASWTSSSTAGIYIGSTNSNLIVRARGIESTDYIPASSITLSSVNEVSSNVVLFGNTDSGSLSVTLDNSAPAATSIAKGSNNVDFAHYRFYATGEDVNMTQLVVRAYNTSGTGSTASTTNEIINVRLYDITNYAKGMTSSSAGTLLGSAVATPSSGASTFSFNLTVPKDDYRVLKVVADVPTNSNGQGSLHFDVPGAGTVSSDVTATGASSNAQLDSTTLTGSATGRTMTVASPTLSLALGSTPIAQSIVTNAQNVRVATINLTAGQYEDIRVSSIKIDIASSTTLIATSTADTTFNNVKLTDAAGNQYGVTKSITDNTTAADYVTFDGIGTGSGSNNPPLVVPAGQTKQIYVSANVIASATGPWYFGVTSTSNIVATGNVSGNSATITGTGRSAAQTVTASATVVFSSASANPLTTLVAVGSSGTGTEVPLLALDVDPSYEDVEITKIQINHIPATGDSSQSDFADNGVKLYKRVNGGAEVLVGSATFVSSSVNSGYAAIFSNFSSPLVFGKDDTNSLIVKAIFNGTANGVPSGSSPLVQFGDGTTSDTSVVTVRGVSSNTELGNSAINGSNTVNISGNQKVLYRSYPTFATVNLGTNNLVNGVENEVYKFSVTAAAGGDIALKQLKFDVDVVDGGTVANSLTLGTFKLFRGSTEITSNVTIVSSTSGVSVKSGGSNMVTGAGQAIYVTWPGTNEEQITAGTTNVYTLKATTGGFTTDADNDYIRIRLANNQATSGQVSDSTDPNYLATMSNVASLTNVVVLGDSSLLNTSSADIIWSDRSATGHTAATSSYTATGLTASSTADWFNGYYVTDTPTGYATLTF